MFKKKSKPKKQQLVLLVIIPILLFLYTNCKFNGSDNFQATKGIKTSHHLNSGGGSGNGESYDGKLFNRKVPGNECNETIVPLGQIRLLENSAILTKNTAKFCGQSVEISPTELIKSKNTDLILAYQEGIYTRELDKLDSTSEIFSEAWCRTQTDAHGEIDYIVTWEEQGNQATVDLFFEKTSSFNKKIRVRRDISSTKIRYFDTQNSISLEIALGAPHSVHSFEIQGQLREPTMGLYSLSMGCRMGGQFDPEAPKMKYPMSKDLFSVNSPIEPLIPYLEKNVEEFTVSPSLPKGLVFDLNSGSIHGTPEEVIESQTYTVQAKFKFGSVQSKITLGIGTLILVQNDDLAGALEQANAQTPLPAIIQLPSRHHHLYGQALKINNDIKIIGTVNTILDAQKLSRIFEGNLNSQLTLESIKLINGRGENFGGAILFLGSFLSLKKVTLENNEVDNKFSDPQNLNPLASGGAIYFAQDSLPVGGSLAIVEGSLSIHDSIFKNNRVPLSGSNLSGGAVFAQTPFPVSITSSHFENNSAVQGGAVNISGISVNIIHIINNSWKKNTAIFGGALNINSSRPTVISNNIFRQNLARAEGGAIYTSGFMGIGDLWIDHSLFEENSSHSGAALFLDGPTLISNSKLSLNKGYIFENFQGAVIHRGGRHPVLLKNNNIFNNAPLKNCFATVNKDNAFYLMQDNAIDDSSCENPL